jgi:pyridoxamine 5'-phosphate oxidase
MSDTMEPVDSSDMDPPLTPEDLGGDPVSAFQRWRDLAAGHSVAAADAMALAAVSAEGRPSVRIVLLRGFDERGFVFYTSRTSRKAAELAARPFAAVLFHWVAPLHRQVRAEGSVELLDDEASDAYFRSRPAGAKISAWASAQSRVVADRQELEQQWAEARRRFPDDDAIPRPRDWGGYRVVPETFEFWQGRQDRLHDRIRFRRAGGGWVQERLAP